MNKVIKDSWPLFFGIFMIMVGNGLQGTLLGVRAEIEDFSTATTGLVMSMYYGGFLAGSILAPKLVSNVGHIRVFTAMASMASATTLLHGIFVDPVWWCVARMISGFSFAALYIVIESWMNDVSTNENRGKVLGTYLGTFYGSMVVGQYLLNIAPPEQIELFVLISVLISVALLPISLSKRPAPNFEAPHPIGIKEVYKASPLGVVGVIISGAGASILFGIGPVFAAQTGMEIREIANFMAFFILGAVSAQLPIGYLSDRIERRKIITMIAFLASISAGLCLFSQGNMELLYLNMFFVGAMALSIYGVCVAYTNDHLSREQYVGASSMLILLNGVGSFFGPFIATLFMSFYGPSAFFGSVGAIYIGICLFALYRAAVNPKVVSVEDQGDYLSVHPRATPVVAQIAEEVIEE